MSSPSVAVIVCSTRPPRVCPQIAAFVVQTIQAYHDNSLVTSHPNLHLIDLASWNLPFFDEPIIPSQTTHHSQYTNSHTRAWSLEIQKHSAFIFVMPQYNWGYPAAIKNAIDYLFHEWTGKPAMVVSYGGHGGGKGAAQLRQVLQGVRMRVVEVMPALAFPNKDMMGKANRGEALRLSGEGAMWEGEREVVAKAFEELMALLGQKKE